MPTEKTVETDGVVLATQSFGRPGDTPLLMIMGATASMLWWSDPLCQALADAGRFVIRYDNRDTGRSTVSPKTGPEYSMDDLADDALRILDAYGIACAHFVGMSLGGMIAQIAALKAPERVASLSLISSSAFDEDDPDLPEMDPAFMAHFGKIGALDWDDRAAVVNFQVESFRIAAGPAASFDVEAARELAGREFDRAINIRSALNHGAMQGRSDWTGRLGDITAPVVVIHGRHDPILSIEHGRKLAAKLPDARLVELDGGHELNRRDWPRIVEEILRQSA